MMTTTMALPEEGFLALKHLAVKRRVTFRALICAAVIVLLNDTKKHNMKGGRR